MITTSSFALCTFHERKTENESRDKYVCIEVGGMCYIYCFPSGYIIIYNDRKCSQIERQQFPF